MFSARIPLILASASPRRRELLARLGLRFTIEPAEIDETPLPGEAPLDFALRMAAAKTRLAAAAHPATCVIGADTVVTLDRTIFGKPGTPEEALAILQTLQGRTHEVITGYGVIALDAGVEVVAARTTRVTFGTFDEPVLKAYVATGEPMDKAGAYGIQGIGTFLVSGIEGSYANVVGLPVEAVVQTLRDHHLVTIR